MIHQLTKYFEFSLTKIQNDFYKKSQKPIAEILMLHRIGNKNPNNLSVYENLIISPEYLESLLLTYIEKGYEFISMDELHEKLRNKLNPDSKKSIVLTIDDGYKDTYDLAYPILKKHHIPFVLYIASAFPDKIIPLWWNYLNDIAINNSVIHLKNDKILNCETNETKQATYIHLSKEILKMGNRIDIQFNQLFNDTLSSIVEKYRHLLIDWDHIASMSLDPLCTIGAHSTNHYGLKYSQKELILKDLLDNKQKLEKITGKQIKHLAFPYGTHYSVGKREYLIAEKAGFVTAVITFSSSIYSYHKKDLFSLPRIQVLEKN